MEDSEDIDDDPTFLASDSPLQPHALIAYDSTEHRDIALIAERLSSQLERVGYITQLADAAAHSMPPPPDYELVVVGLTVHRVGHHAILRWLEAGMYDVPSAAFVIGSSALPALERVSHTISWSPLLVAAFHGLDESAIADFADRLSALTERERADALRNTRDHVRSRA